MTDVPLLVVKRSIGATPARLFAAWTEPQQLAAWWGPDGVRCVGAAVDAREGGRYRIDNEMPGGEVVTIEGAFVEVLAPRRLVFTWTVSAHPGAEELVTVRFDAESDEPARTLVTVEHRRIADEASRQSHKNGWVGCLAGLAGVIESSAES